VPDGATYTGLIVDCRGLRILSGISPKVFDPDGREVYGTIAVSLDYAIDTGIVGYSRSMEPALRSSRVGSRPLVVRAVACRDPHRLSPTLSRRDAERVREANEHDKFLQRTAVVFVVDPL
jgi:hypothetical protein